MENMGGERNGNNEPHRYIQPDKKEDNNIHSPNGSEKLISESSRSLKRVKIISAIVIVAMIVTPPSVLIPVYLGAHSVGVISVSPDDNAAVWLAPPDTKVDKRFAPAYIISPRIQSFDVIAVKNEYEFGQIVISPLNPLLGYGGDRGVPSVTFKAEYANTSSLTVTVYFVEYVMDNFPDKLVPIEINGTGPKGSYKSLILNEQRNYPVWIKIHIPADAAVGLHIIRLKGYISYGDNNTERLFELKINVHTQNYTLPIERPLRTAFHPLSDNYGLLENFNAHRVDIEGCPLSYTVNTSDNSVIFNWSTFDRITGFNLANGSVSFDVTFRDWRRYFDGFTESFNTTYKNYYKAVAQHLAAKNWTRYAYIYIWDEPSSSDFPTIRSLAELCKEAAPDLKILLTTAPTPDKSILFGYIDIWVVIEHEVPKFYEYIQQRRELGEEVWYYPCLFPKSPWANFMVYNTLLETRVATLIPFRYGLDGLLYWHTMAYYMGNYGMGYNGYLDGWLIYSESGTDGTVYYNSIRWDVIGDGLEDAALLYELKKINTDRAKSYIAELESLMCDWRMYSRNNTAYTQLFDSIKEYLGGNP